MDHGLWDFIPVWALLGLTIAFIVLFIECGFRLGQYRKRILSQETEISVGSMVGAALGLLAFMLTFTFGMAASRFDDRRQVILAESNAIGTTYLRVDLLPKADRVEIRNLLREYVDIRLNTADVKAVSAALSRSEQIQQQIWSRATNAAEADPRSVSIGLFIGSLNDMIDMHAKRVMISLRNRIPSVIWGVLYFVTALSMTLIGYYEGVAGSRRSLAVPLMVITFSSVMFLITDLDRPREGLLQVSQQAMIDLRNSMEPQSP